MLMYYVVCKTQTSQDNYLLVRTYPFKQMFNRLIIHTVNNDLGLTRLDW